MIRRQPRRRSRQISTVGSMRIDVSPRSVVLVLLGFTAGWREMQIAGVHLFTLTAVLLFVMSRPSKIRHRALPPMVMLYAAALVASTAVLGDLVQNPKLAAQLCLLTGSAVLIYLSVTVADISRVLSGFVAAATLSSLVAVGQEFGLISYTAYTDESGLARPIGLVGEPDWVGYFAAASLLILILSRWTGYLVWASMAINGFALMFSFARAAWLALLVPLLVVVALIVVGDSLFQASKPRVLGAVAALPAVVAVAWVTLGDTFPTRVLSIIDSSHHDANARHRLEQMDTLWSMAASSPWYGRGLSASGGVAADGTYRGAATSNSVASNWLLGLWVDARWLAVPLALALVAVALGACRAAPGLLLMGALINSMFSNVLFSPVSWLWVGLSLAILNTIDWSGEIHRRRHRRCVAQQPTPVPVSAVFDDSLTSPALGTSPTRGRHSR